jgi:hypothetical protein
MPRMPMRNDLAFNGSIHCHVEHAFVVLQASTHTLPHLSLVLSHCSYDALEEEEVVGGVEGLQLHKLVREGEVEEEGEDAHEAANAYAGVHAYEKRVALYVILQGGMAVVLLG